MAQSPSAPLGPERDDVRFRRAGSRSAFGLVGSAVRPERHEGIGGTRQGQSGVGNLVAEHIEAAQDGGPMQLRDVLKHRFARLLGSVSRFGRLIGAGRR